MWTSPVNGKSSYSNKDNFVEHLLETKMQLEAKAALLREEIAELVAEKQAAVTEIQKTLAAIRGSFLDCLGEGKTQVANRQIAVSQKRSYTLGADGLTFVRKAISGKRKIVNKYFRLDPVEKTATLSRAMGDLVVKQEEEPGVELSAEETFLFELGQFRTERLGAVTVKIKEID